MSTSEHVKFTADLLVQFTPPSNLPSDVPRFVGEWDEEGVYVYQAFRDEIADWALEHQQFGGDAWKPVRMTWIKPSFAWMLYRSGYGMKPGQTRVLKIKLSHETLATLLSGCKCVNTNRATKKKSSLLDDGRIGRVQWDPERDLYEAEADGREPRRMMRRRAIQIGLPGRLSEYYAKNILSIEDVTQLARRVAIAHRLKGPVKKRQEVMECLRDELPIERPYMPLLSEPVLCSLALLPGDAADIVAHIGRGKATGAP